HALCNSISDFIVLAHLDGTVIDGPKWCNATGQNIAENDQTFWFDSFHSDDRAMARDRWNRAVEAGVPCDIESRILWPGGEYRWARARCAPVLGDGVTREWIVTFGDIQEVTAAPRQADDGGQLTGAQIRAARAILNW